MIIALMVKYRKGNMHKGFIFSQIDKKLVVYIAKGKV